MLGRLGEQNGYLACRDCTLGDLAVAAHISALDYFGEVPWAEFPIAAEWYVKMKSRPSFRTLARRSRARPAARIALCRARRLRTRDTIRAFAKATAVSMPCALRAGEADQAGEHLATFLAEGRHGTMDWMARTRTAALRPNLLWPEAKSIVVLGANYGPAGDPREQLARKSNGAISVYAQGDDYHDVLKTKLKQLGGLHRRTLRRGREGVHRYRARDGKAAGAGSRPRLAGQAHQSRFARIRLVAVHRFGVHDARRSSRMRRNRIIAANAGAASMPARRQPSPRPIASMRGAAFPI
jgi:hypothetical protein